MVYRQHLLAQALGVPFVVEDYDGSDQMFILVRMSILVNDSGDDVEYGSRGGLLSLTQDFLTLARLNGV